jgi:TonB family protein
VRRVRRGVPGLSQGLLSRFSAAIAVSAAFHVFLVYGFSLPEGSSVQHAQVMHARLQPVPLSAPLLPKARETNPAPRASQNAREDHPVLPEANLPVERPAAIENVPFAEPAQSMDGNASSILPDPTHYPANELDVYPRALHTIAPTYPIGALETRTSGFVTLLVLIDEVGRVTVSTVVDATPDGVFEQAAQEALAQAVFYPAQREGRSVRSQLLVKVEFDPNAAADVH